MWVTRVVAVPVICTHTINGPGEALRAISRGWYLQGPGEGGGRFEVNWVEIYAYTPCSSRRPGTATRGHTRTVQAAPGRRGSAKDAPNAKIDVFRSHRQIDAWAGQTMIGKERSQNSGKTAGKQRAHPPRCSDRPGPSRMPAAGRPGVGRQPRAAVQI